MYFALAFAAVLSFPLGARAGSVQTYAFSGNDNSITCCASYTYSAQTVDISGTFEYDATLQDISSANVILSTAASDIMFAGSSMSFTSIAAQSTVGDAYYLELADANGDKVQFLFDDGATNLTSDSSVALDRNVYYTNYLVETPGLYFPISSQLFPDSDTTTGYADPATSAPEPASLGLLVSALAVLAALRRRSAQV